MRKPVALLLLLAMTLLSACATQNPGANSPQRRIRIGFSMDTLAEERWQRDRDLFVARARELGAEVLIQAAAGDDDLQLSQAENMLRRGIDVLVIVPHNARAMAPVVTKAHEAGVKVIAYDRLILDADVDLYVSFDSERVGELQAQDMLRRVPKGNYVYVGGAPTDNNASLLRAGVMKVLQPHIDRGDIRLVSDQFTPEWLPERAGGQMAEALTKTQGKIDAVICANDGTAGGVVQALYQHGLAGRIPVAGQDADLAAVRRLVDGTQVLTVYKPIRLLATKAAETAVAMATGKEYVTNHTVNNGYGKVGAFLLPPVPVTFRTMRETVIKDGFHQESDIFGPAKPDQPSDGH
ncbi:MAG: D-xylose transporter substrate-binding protein [Symbiobacteriaceae bacterium]|jgi:D-xylose transport system substrate-binding protein|nr:D-xylose transporter substrate-binding protein [Symbiobacteriaceae bacterium]